MDRIVSHSKSRSFIPNICIPEVLTVFASLHHVGKEKDGKSTKFTLDEYKKVSATFLGEIRSRKIYPYDLARVHIVKSDPVIFQSFQVKITVPRQTIDAVDSLVISMALEMSEIYKGNLVLVSADTHQVQVARKLKIKVVNPLEARAATYLT